VRELAAYGRIAALATITLVASTSACGTSATEPASKPAVQPDAYVPLARSAHPLARPELDRGPLDPDKLISNLAIVFRLTPAQQADRDALIAAQLDPGSPSYHQWLTTESYAARFGATPDAIARTTAWLASQGLTVHETSPLASRVTFSGRVADLQAAFHAPMRRYQAGRRMHYAMATAPSLPASLADVVLAVHNTHDFFPHPMVKLGRVKQPEYKNGFQYGFGPPDWANVYDVTKLYTQGVSGTPITGAGVTIGVVGIAEVGQSDLNQFRTTFGLPLNPITMTLVPNTGPATGGSGTMEPGSGVEAYLDTEWSGGIATGASINYVFTGGNDINPDDATSYIIDHNLTGIISESFGGCEYGLTPADADVVAVYGSAAELLGITYLAASGDSGADACIEDGFPGLYVDLPAAYPGVTSVGGSEFPSGSITYSSTNVAEGYSTAEECWNEADNPNYGVGAGGGGISNTFLRPSYQSAIPTCTILGSLPSPVSPANMRQVPDLAVNAASDSNPDFIMCEFEGMDCGVNGTSDKLYGVGGTSAAAPAFAGVVALITQATGGGRLGNINPLLYTLAASTPTAFHDIVNGNNEVECTAGTDPGCPAGGVFGYAATTGYDCATGLGSPDAFNLATAWAALAPTTITIAAAPTSAAPGATINLSATVTVPTPNVSSLGGTVRFTFQSYAGGTPDLTWTLGTDGVTDGTPATSTGTASWSGIVPPGLVDPAAQYVDVVAMYGGDAHHLASTSAKVRITYSTEDFCLVPSYGSILPNEGFTFSSTGGTPPIQWFTGDDSTCVPFYGTDCSTIDVSTGAFVAGTGEPGYVVVVGIDANGVEQYANLIVGDPSADAGGPPWGDAQAPYGNCNALPPDAGFTLGGAEAGTPDDASGPGPFDSGSVSAMDSGTPEDSSMPPVVDAGVDGPVRSDAGGDAGPPGGGSSGGCACEVTGAGRGAPAEALAGLGLGLTLALRRRRSTPAPIASVRARSFRG
jgi:MYXO-CTERM domain-containing protein